MTQQPAAKPSKVLYVDDEEQALKYFRKAYEKDFDVLTAASADAASRLLHEHGDDIAILITDQRMPQRTGVDLLQEVRRDYPAIVRILTTAYSDLDSAIEAVNSGAIFRYVTKPWDIRELRGTLLRALDFHNLQRERDLLLCEKLSVLQRMLVLDRARTLTVLAASLEGRLRHPLHAVKAYLEFAATRPELTSSPFAAGWDDLWALTVDESQMMIDAVQHLLEATRPTGFAPVALGDELQAALAGAAGSARIEGDTAARIVADADMLRRLITHTLGRLRSPDANGQSVTIRLQNDADHVRVTITSDGPGWSREQLLTLLGLLGRSDHAGDTTADLLVAYLIVHHHGGELRVHPNQPAGPGLEIRLPNDAAAAQHAPLPGDWLDAVFTRFEP